MFHIAGNSKFVVGFATPSAKVRDLGLDPAEESTCEALSRRRSHLTNVGTLYTNVGTLYIHEFCAARK